MKSSEYEGNRVPMNLQLFAEDIDDELVDIEDDDVEDDDSSYVDEWEDEDIDDVDEEPDEVVPEKPLVSDTPDHHAFAELRVQNKQYKDLDRLVKDQFGVESVKEYFDRLQQQMSQEQSQELTEQAENGDINAIVELAKRQLQDTPEFKAMRQQREQMESQKYLKTIEDFNTEYRSYGFEINGAESLEKLPNAEKVFSLMGTNPGLELKDAFLIVNKDLVLNKTSKASKQKALNNVNAKRKLVTEGDGAGENNAKGINQDLYNALLEDGHDKKSAMKLYRKYYG